MPARRAPIFVTDNLHGKSGAWINIRSLSELLRISGNQKDEQNIRDLMSKGTFDSFRITETKVNKQEYDKLAEGNPKAKPVVEKIKKRLLTDSVSEDATIQIFFVRTVNIDKNIDSEDVLFSIQSITGKLPVTEEYNNRKGVWIDIGVLTQLLGLVENTILAHIKEKTLDSDISYIKQEDEAYKFFIDTKKPSYEPRDVDTLRKQLDEAAQKEIFTRQKRGLELLKSPHIIKALELISQIELAVFKNLKNTSAEAIEMYNKVSKKLGDMFKLD